MSRSAVESNKTITVLPAVNIIMKTNIRYQQHGQSNKHSLIFQTLQLTPLFDLFRSRTVLILIEYARTTAVKNVAIAANNPSHRLPPQTAHGLGWTFIIAAMLCRASLVSAVLLYSSTVSTYAASAHGEPSRQVIQHDRQNRPDCRRKSGEYPDAGGCRAEAGREEAVLEDAHSAALGRTAVFADVV